MSTSKPADPGRGTSVERVAAAASRLGLAVEVVRLDADAGTAEAAARACGCAVAQIVKSIVFRVEGAERHVLFLTAGDRRVDPAKAAALAGVPLAKADAAGVRAHTGFAIGGVAPLGHLTPIETWMDRDLLAHPLVWAAAGSPNHVFAVAPEDLRRAAGAVVGDFVAR
jgi:prolyl-tRNA editing enzyme YbaK/EbsC (Cys-tRNA(Pro) deacylase)